MGKATAKPLTEYASKIEARAGADHFRMKFGSVMNPYQCAQCFQWHLAPLSSCSNNHNYNKDYKETRESRSCFGKASGTRLKEYHSEEEATGAASFVLEKYGNQMVPYQCKDCQSWHLSPADRHTKDFKVTRQSKGCYGKVSTFSRVPIEPTSN
jgi:hypothetical protein